MSRALLPVVLLCVLAAVLVPRSAAPYHRVQVNVAADGTDIVGDAANEPSLAVDPRRPLRMAIGWRHFPTVTNSHREAGWAYSRDGGRTWHFRGSVEPGAFRSDPVLESDADGRFYYFSMLFTPPPNLSRDCHVFASADGGRTWGPAVSAYGGDKPWMAVDVTSGPGRNHVYAAWNPHYSETGTDFFTRSVDGGATFQHPVTMAARPVIGTLAVAADGTLYLTGFDTSGGITSPTPIAVARSTTAENPLAVPDFTSVLTNLGGDYTKGNDDFSFPNPDGYLGQVWVDADRSIGPYGGNLYLLASVDPPGADPLDVRFSRSEDGGLTWSRSTRVNSDPAAAGAWQWFGTLSVAPSGRLDAIWNDAQDPMLPNVSALCYSSSSDGGRTWSVGQRLSDPWNSHAGLPQQNKIGDYYDMVSDDVGADIAWAATFTGGQDVYYTRVGDFDCNRNAVGDSLDLAHGTSTDTDASGIPDECECPELPYSRWDIHGAGTMGAHDGWYLRVSSAGAEAQNWFLYDEGNDVRLYAVESPPGSGYAVLPAQTCWVKRFALAVGQSWRSWFGEPTAARVVRVESVTVPAGTFSAFVVEHRAIADGLLRARIWFVAGLGVARLFDYERGEHFELANSALVGGSGFQPLALGNWWSSSSGTGVPEPPGRAAGRRIALSATPNPQVDGARVGFSLPSPSPASLAVFDVRGRRVRELWSGWLGAGAHEFHWDGRTDERAAAPAGVYLLRLEAGGTVSVAKVVRLQ